MAKTQVFCGMLVHATKRDYMKILPNHAIGVKDGKVSIIVKAWNCWNVQRDIVVSAFILC